MSDSSSYADWLIWQGIPHPSTRQGIFGHGGYDSSDPRGRRLCLANERLFLSIMGSLVRLLVDDSRLDAMPSTNTTGTEGARRSMGTPMVNAASRDGAAATPSRPAP